MQLQRHSTGLSQLSSKKMALPASRKVSRTDFVSRRCSPVSAAPKPDLLLEAALLEARANNFEAARSRFRRLTEAYPAACKGYVSWAQMEKRMSDEHCVSRCRAVLQEGLRANPSSACLIQAWGLMELQRGNWLAALMMLERAVKLEPKCSPVLRWQQVNTARRTVGSSPRRAHSRHEHSRMEA